MKVLFDDESPPAIAEVSSAESNLIGGCSDYKSDVRNRSGYTCSGYGEWFNLDHDDVIPLYRLLAVDAVGNVVLASDDSDYILGVSTKLCMNTSDVAIIHWSDVVKENTTNRKNRVLVGLDGTAIIRSSSGAKYGHRLYPSGRSEQPDSTNRHLPVILSTFNTNGDWFSWCYIGV